MCSTAAWGLPISTHAPAFRSTRSSLSSSPTTTPTTISYGPLLIVGWVQGLALDVSAFGPPPLKQMTDDFMRAYKQTVDFWAEDFHMKPLTAVNVQEISGAGPVMQDDNVKVSSIVVEHPPVKPALAYRFDFKDRSIAFSGDTAPLAAVAQMAKGADVLVHETMYVPALENYLRAAIARGQPSSSMPSWRI